MTKIHSGRILGMSHSWNSGSVQIAANSAISGSVLVAGRELVGLAMPTAWDAASLTFDVCACPNGTYFPLYKDNVEVVLQVSASRYLAGSPLDLLNSAYGFRLRSGSTVSDADVQSATRTFAYFIQ